MFVDPQRRQVVANQKDGEGALAEQGGVFTGLLPASVNIANTATQWSGVLWTHIIWPLPDDPVQRNTLLAHEMFHRIQDQLPRLVQRREVANAHLDTLEGRYLLQLEWRALASALRCTTQSACQRALGDALVFRSARYQLFPEAAAQERVLELHEGLAEYTGVVIGNKDPADQLQAALWDLTAPVSSASFVRSFAYATGPALGLLLDKYAAGWRQSLQSSTSLDDLLQRATEVRLPRDAPIAAARAASRYDGATLRRAEVTREQQRQKILAANRAKFVAGPVLVIPLNKISIQFSPQNLQPLDDLGTVYPTLRILDDWGVLEVNDGALLRADWSTITVVAPAKPGTISAGQTLTGDGWTLQLKPQWSVIPAERSGDLTIQGPPRESVPR
jgi:hypothetical protein